MSYKENVIDLGLPSRHVSLALLNEMLKHLNGAVIKDGKPLEILYQDFVTSILTFAGMTLSKSLFDNATREIKQSDLKNIATELTIAFRHTLDKSLGIEYEAYATKNTH